MAVTSYEAANKLGFDDPQPSADTLRQVKDAVHTGNSDDLSTDTMPIDAEVDMQQRFVSISLFNNTEVTVPAFATIKFHDDAAEHFNARQEITALSTASARRPRAEAANRFLVALLWFIPFSGVIAATFFDISSQAAWFTAGATVLGYLIMLLKNTITYRQYQSMITDHFVAEQNTLAFTHEGIAVLKDTEIAFVNQSTLMRIEETSSNILIFNSASSALIVPKRIFKSTRETGDFIKLVTDNLLSNVEETTRQVADQKQES